MDVLKHTLPLNQSSSYERVKYKKQKAENKKIGSKRVVAEHTIGGMKVFHILSHKFRNRMNGMVNEVIFQVAGLWNLKIQT